nr:carbohydrate kinase family protein [Candidatus Levybacteria bacterium]
MLDILCIGDAKLDIFIQVPDDNPHVSLDKKTDKLLISYGEKISVDKHFLDIGGNAANAATGISSLGFNAGLCAEIGKDEFSQKILNKLSKKNVNIDYLVQQENEETSFSVSVSYKGDRVLFTEHAERKHDFNFENLQTNFVYLTSLGNIWENAYKNVLDFVESKKIKFAFNPGTLQLEKRDNLVFEVIEKTDYLFVNKEEAQELLYGKELGLEREENNNSLIKKMLFGLKGLGAKNVIITDSQNGSYVQDEKNDIYYLGILNEKIVEKTGAGDSYTAGFLAAILNGLPITDAMVWGTINAASVVKKIGAQDGLLTKEQIEEKIKSLKNFTPEKLI